MAVQWTILAQGPSGTLTVDSTDIIWQNGARTPDGGWGVNITVNQYQDSTHIGLSDGTTHKTGCNSMGDVNNTKYVSATQLSLNGQATSNVSSLTTANAPLKVTFTETGYNTSTSNGKFYLCNISDDDAVANVTFQAFQVTGSQTQWKSGGANGLSNAVALADQSSASSHDFYLAFSASPTTTGQKSGRLKISLTYV